MGQTLRLIKRIKSGKKVGEGKPGADLISFARQQFDRLLKKKLKVPITNFHL